MSELTPNLGLFKYNPQTDGKEVFSINTALNDNWDILDNLGSGKNIGEIVTSTIPLTDAGLHLLDGALIQGNGIYSAFVKYIAGLVSTYPNLFVTESAWQTAVTTYGVCGKFVYDSTNNTVRLPKITGILEGTTDVTALGDLVEAGLPNITGGIPIDDFATTHEAVNPWGAFERGRNIGVYYVRNATASGTYFDYNIDASRSSSIYGNSTTVQPQTIKAFYYIVIATSTKTDIQVDIDEIATDLNGKADVDLTNTTPAISFATAMNNAGIRTVVETYSNGTSWYRVYSDGWCEQGGIINSVSQDSYTSATISLLKSYKNTNYSVLLTQWDNGQTLGIDAATNGQSVHSKRVNNFVIATYSWTYGRMWQACGYIN